jgi:hypothetical protein
VRKRPDIGRVGKGTLAWGAFDAALILWAEREALLDEKARPEAVQRVAWALGQTGAENGARAAAVAAVAVVAAGEGAAAGAAATAAAPIVVGLAAGWTVGKGVQLIRRRLGPGEPPTD